MSSVDSSSSIHLDINGAPYNPDLSPFYPKDEKPEPEPGYFILPENSTWKEGDRWCRFAWSQDYRTDRGGRSREALDRNISAYSRLISSDPSLHAKMQEYAKTHGRAGNPERDIDEKISAAKSRAESAAEELKRLETQKRELTEIKAGDWVVAIVNTYTCYTKGRCYQVRETETCWGSLGTVSDDNGSSTNGADPSRFRKATPAEVSAHLAKLEAEKQKITVRSDDGRDYAAEFFPGYVQFGCAKISNRVIVDSRRLFSRFDGISDSKFPVSIKIGKGTFTPEILRKLTEKLKN